MRPKTRQHGGKKAPWNREHQRERKNIDDKAEHQAERGVLLHQERAGLLEKISHHQHQTQHDDRIQRPQEDLSGDIAVGKAHGRESEFPTEHARCKIPRLGIDVWNAHTRLCAVPQVLIIETSTPSASIALAAEGEIIAGKTFSSDRRHNAALFEPLEEVIETGGSRSFEAVFVGSGPGSYSGTRVGIAAAQGAALVAGCKAIAIPSILSVPEALTGEPCVAVGDARRGSYWIAKISEGQLITEPELTDEIGLDSAVRQAEESGAPVFCMEAIRGKDIHLARPSAAGLWQAWQSAPPKTRALWAGKIPQPIYLKPPHITPSKKEVFG